MEKQQSQPMTSEQYRRHGRNLVTANRCSLSGCPCQPLQPAHLTEYENQLPRPTLRLDYPETFSQRLPNCPYLCDDGLLWKSVPRIETVDDITVFPMADEDIEFLGQEVFVVADACFWCC